MQQQKAENFQLRSAFFRCLTNSHENEFSPVNKLTFLSLFLHNSQHKTKPNSANQLRAPLALLARLPRDANIQMKIFSLSAFPGEKIVSSAFPRVFALTPPTNDADDDEQVQLCVRRHTRKFTL